MADHCRDTWDWARSTRGVKLSDELLLLDELRLDDDALLIEELLTAEVLMDELEALLPLDAIAIRIITIPDGIPVVRAPALPVLIVVKTTAVLPVPAPYSVLVPDIS